jgi:hypothetical protein
VTAGSGDVATYPASLVLRHSWRTQTKSLPVVAVSLGKLSVMIRYNACRRHCISPPRAEFVIQDCDGNAVPRSTHNFSRYDQLKKTCTFQQNRPVDKQLDVTPFRQPLIGPKKYTSRTKIAGLT